MPVPDISTRSDIELLVNQFYTRIRADERLGPIFNLHVKDWSVHLPKMYTFWESMLLDTANYKGNPMLVHIALDKMTPLESDDFEHWLKLWHKTVTELFAGARAEQAVHKASLMAKLMSYKVEQSRNPGFIQ